MTDKALHETDGGGGGVSNPNASEKQDKSLWWLVGFILALIIMAAVLAIL